MKNIYATSQDNSVTDKNNTEVKILLVDDKKENLFSLEQLLEDDEFNTAFIKCTSGNEALNIALKEEIALILLDVQMPEMDGYEVARFLKANKKTSQIPVIFVTALDHEVNYIIEGYKKGAIDYLFKPLNPAITKAKVNAFIQKYLQQKELEQKNIILQNLAILVNNSVDLICILDENSLTIKSLNLSWQKVLGIEEEKLIDQSITDYFSEDNAFPFLINPVDSHILFENCLNAASGEKIWFSWSFVRKNGLWYGNGKDITKNKQIEKQLASANEVLEKKVLERTADLLSVNEQLKDEVKKRSVAEKDLHHFNERLLKTNEELDSFVYVASHDLKAPIANIESLFAILKKKLSDRLNANDLQLFDYVGKSLDKFNAILKDLGRITSIHKDLQDSYTEVNLVETFEDIKEDIKDLITTSNPSILVDLNVENVFYAKKHIRSIFYNLVSNAIKYRSPERELVIEIKSYSENDFIVLSIKDNGLGLNENQKSKVFSMFKRFHPQVEGSGVGLYMLRKIISNNGGEIEVESSQDVGSEFKVYLKKASAVQEL